MVLCLIPTFRRCYLKFYLPVQSWVVRGGPFDIQGGGGGALYFIGSHIFVCVHMKARYFFGILAEPDIFFWLDIRARYFFCVYYNMT